jgi:Chromo (CHRromatin Organisation MOdifier) domain
VSDIHLTRLLRQLTHCWLGPYQVTWKIGTHAYELALHLALQWLHPMLHIVKLTPALDDPIPGQRMVPPPHPILREGKEHFEVKEVLDSRWRQNRLQFLIRWKGYRQEENSWEHADDVNVPALVANFYWVHPEAPRHIRLAATLWICL